MNDCGDGDFDSRQRGALLVDMDRTLIRGDTTRLFLRYMRDAGQPIWRPTLRFFGAWLGNLGGFVAPEACAEVALIGLRGRPAEQLREACSRWFAESGVRYVTPTGRQTIRAHQALGGAVVLVTSALEYLAAPVARSLGIESVVCTQLEVERCGLLTGRIVTPMSWGIAKLARVARVADTEGFSIGASTYYTDSIHDIALLESVGSPVAVNPDWRLRRVALRRGWPILGW